MTIPLIAAFGQAIFMLLLGGMAVFLILLVLVQRGRGGGLAGALGGMGGSSAFGAKAGDVFTKITIGTATIWIVLCIAAAKLTPSNQSRLDVGADAPPVSTATISGVGGAEDEATAEGESEATDAGQADAVSESAPPAEEAPAEPATETEPAASDEAETENSEEAQQ